MRILTSILLIIFLFMAWDVAWWYGFGVSPLSPEALKTMVNKGDAPVIIDVRTKAEFEAFHIPGARNVPYPATLIDLAQQAPDPNAPVVITCLTGHRSPPVVKQMQDGGYTNVHNLTWGMLAWKIFGGETTSGK